MARKRLSAAYVYFAPDQTRPLRKVTKQLVHNPPTAPKPAILRYATTLPVAPEALCTREGLHRQGLESSASLVPRIT